MSRYKWDGINPLGEAVSGEIIARSVHDARQLLRQQGILARSIRKQIRFYSVSYPKLEMLSLCFRQWSISLSQGVPILHLIKSMASYQSQGPFKLALEQIHHHLSQGGTFYEALKQHPKCFPKIATDWINMGEQYGTLPDILQHVAEYYALQAQIKKRLYKALTYPLTIFFMASLIMLSLMLIVVPQFASFYQYFSADLPWATQWLILLSDGLKRSTLVIIGSSVIFTHITRKLYKKKPTFTRYAESILFSLPILGNLLKLTALARIINTIHTTCISGLSLVEGFQAASQVTGYVNYQDKMCFMLQLLRQGESLHQTLQRGQLFPMFVVQMLSLGEETGTLPAAFRQINTHYELEIEQRIYTLSTVFEPLIMTVLGITIGGFMIALYLPILNLGTIL